MQQDDERPVAVNFVIQPIGHDEPRRLDRA
jgi:hypothetical protein